MTTPIPEAIEVVAVAIWEAATNVDASGWKLMSQGTQDRYRALAIAALSAAYPLMEAQAKVEALAEVVDKHEREIGDLIDERDSMHEWADRLAYAIAPMEVIGEHSSGNNPWENALDYLPDAKKPKAEAWQEGFMAGQWEEADKAGTLNMTRIQIAPNPYIAEGKES